MARTVSIGCQDYETIRTNGYFYIDKTRFIKEWWERGDSVTLIDRPRRFGKTLNMSMVEKFFDVDYAGRSDLFEGLDVWKDEKYRQLQGTWPVISLSFAKVKETSYINTRKKICQIITRLYNQYDFLEKSDRLNQKEVDYIQKITAEMDEYVATESLNALTEFLYKYYGRKVIILLDEYDTPMQEAYVNGYWEEMTAFIRNLFNATFKTNPYLERAILTGITRIPMLLTKHGEFIFSDLNNLKVVTITSEEYEDSFGFTEEEVFTALEEFGRPEKKEEVKNWYDGFIFGSVADIYNPWSIINYLDTGKVGAYWANSSSNSLVGKLVREGSPEIKMTMEKLLHGETFHAILDEQIVFSQLDHGEDAVWSLLLASGYLKVMHYEFNTAIRKAEYDLKLTNMEVLMMFEQMISGWFGTCRGEQNGFLRALLSNDTEAMNDYMNDIACELFSSFDTGRNPSEKTQPERFYHGFVLGMMVELRDRYVITSNKESGYGRYDIMLEPRAACTDVKGLDAKGLDAKGMDAFVIEFKVVHTRRGETLESAVQAALDQIEKKQYAAALLAKGIPAERIHRYGFAFCGKEVLIG